MRGPPEERFTEEGAEDVGQVSEVEVGRRKPATSQSLAPVAVVGRSTLGIRQDLVRLGRLAEPLLGVRGLRDVRMELARKLPEGPFDLCVRSAALDTEDLVVVALGRRHQGIEGTGSR